MPSQISQSISNILYHNLTAGVQLCLQKVLFCVDFPINSGLVKIASKPGGT
jgi:hypothetical protein